MSPRTRLAVLAAGLVLLVVAFVALRPGGGDEPVPAVQTQAQAPPAATIEPSGGVEAPPPATTTTTTPAEPEPAVPTIEVREDGTVAGGVQELEFASGDEIAFRIASAIDEEVHVHGYDVVEQLRAGRTTAFRFDGDLEGIFEIELHGSGSQIAELRVSPS